MLLNARFAYFVLVFAIPSARDRTLGSEDVGVGDNPRLIFRPTPEKANESNLIWFKRGDPNGWKPLIKSLDNFLKPYDSGEQNGPNFKTCSKNDPITSGKDCRFDLHELGSACTKQKEYGYSQNTPCVLLAMNEIYGWEPEPFGPSDILPYDMPQKLKDIIKDPKSYVNGSMVWLSCQGQNPTDKENIGEIEYYPQVQGFPTYYFPFTNNPGYLEPAVMIRFKNLQPGILINIECKAWAKNIKHSRMYDDGGGVFFEILMD